jgi:hypothetical protein
MEADRLKFCAFTGRSIAGDSLERGRASMKSLSTCAVALLCAGFMAACGGGGGTPTVDAVTMDQPGGDAVPDAAGDEAATDVREDEATTETGPEVAPDVAPEIVPEVLPDVEPDLPPETEVPPPCTSAKDCADDDPCTKDACDAGTGACTHEPIAGCKACKLDGDCADADGCTADTCDPATGTCDHELIPHCKPCTLDSECDDGDGCTEDVCDALHCKSVPVPVAGCRSCQGLGIEACDDGNACTLDACADKGYCVYVCQCQAGCATDQDCFVVADLCNPIRCDVAMGADACKATSCVAHPVDCDDQDACTVDLCDPGNGACVHAKIPDCGPCASDNDCDDGDPCTVDWCSPEFLVCVHAADPCDDADDCTADTCAPAVGCLHSDTCGAACTSDGDCDDGNACTVDSCAMDGVCVHSILSCDDGVACTVDSCDPVAGCSNRFVGATCAVDGDCDDGDPCTADTCGATGCCGHTPVPACRDCQVDGDCDDGNPCTDDVCDPTSLKCSSTGNALACDDGDACTVGEACSGGRCSGGLLLACADADPCTADTCDRESGCLHTQIANCGGCAADGDCDDQDLCTADRCDLAAGVCRHTRLTCDDTEACTYDLCRPAVGCSFTPNAIACDDGNACTLGDACTDGACAPGTGVPTCDDGLDCTDESCDPGVGCVFAPHVGSCEDGDPCTSDDACADSRCVGGPATDCDDKDVCTTDSCSPLAGCEHAPISCDDGLACTIDTCDPVTGCVHTPKECGDGNECTDDACDPATGECVHADAICDDHETCTEDTCDPSTGCVFTPVDGSCSDGSECTVGDQCAAGRCLPGAPLVCDDGVFCTDDACDPLLGCVWKNNTLPCDDLAACTVFDTCANGTCAGIPYECSAPGACQKAGVCNGDGTCTYPPQDDGTPCDDGNPCTLKDGCASGKCVGTAVTCKALDACHDAGTCDPATGLCSNPPKADGTPCDDGDKCSLVDSCTKGVCGGATNPCHEKPDNTCTLDYCNAALPGDGCYHTYQPDGTACEDGNACTVGDKCQTTTFGPVCQPGAPRVCPNDNPCMNVSCDPAVGCVYTPNTAPCDDGNPCTSGDVCGAGKCAGKPYTCAAPAACHLPGTCNGDGTCAYLPEPNGTPCNDKDLCTQTDACFNGACVGGNPVKCLALDGCHVAGTCAPATGVCSNPPAADGTPCDDGKKCSILDQCAAGACGGTTNACSDSNPCTTDLCSEDLPGDGCYHNPVPNGGACNDGNACTVNDACTNGACTGAVRNCSDGNVCTDDSCNPATGCVHTNNTAPCNDGITCTSGDACSGGSCQHGTPTNSLCNDGRKCTNDVCDLGASTPDKCTHAGISNCNCEGNDNNCPVGERCNWLFGWWCW